MLQAVARPVMLHISSALCLTLGRTKMARQRSAGSTTQMHPLRRHSIHQYRIYGSQTERQDWALPVGGPACGGLCLWGGYVTILLMSEPAPPIRALIRMPECYETIRILYLYCTYCTEWRQVLAQALDAGVGATISISLGNPLPLR